VGTLGGFAWLLVSRGTVLTHEWIVALGPQGPGGAALAAVGRVTNRIGVSPEQLSTRARALAETAASGAAAVAEAIAAATASTAIALLFAMLSMQFILRNWAAVATRAQETLPLRPDYTAGLFAEFRRVGRTTLLGTMGTGVAQGVLATLGFWMTGVPEPLLFGAGAAVASLVPPVGAMLVWVPAGLMSLAVAVLRLYATEARKRRADLQAEASR
jgi:predicted PurR-regulated permease PerM